MALRLISSYDHLSRLPRHLIASYNEFLANMKNGAELAMNVLDDIDWHIVLLRRTTREIFHRR